MRVTFNGKFFDANATGVQRVAMSLIRALDAGLARGVFDFGDRPEIVCPRDAAVLPVFDVMSERRGGLFTWQPWEQFDLPRLAHGRLLVNLCNLAPLSATGHVTMIHDAQVFLTPESYSRAFGEWYRFALPRIGRGAARILTVSNFSRDMLVRCGVAPPEKIEVIHNGVDHMAAVVADHSVVRRWSLEARRYVVCVGGAQAHKNVRVLCEAFRRRELAGLRLVLAGSVAAADFRAAGVELPEATTLTGRLSDQELRGLLEGALAYACPSTTEGFGLPPMEAMYVGCPAVAAPCGALPEVCGEAALWAEPDDPAAWATAFLRLAEDPRARDEASARGRAHASQYRWERAAAQLYGVLCSVGKLGRRAEAA
jgi:glycosyltransferase involved in cell wall biosynthesis